LVTTHRIVSHVIQITGFKCIDLKTKNISQIDCKHRNRNDDFLTVIKDIVSGYELMIFTTPVYWYSMSGIMKKFFDRFSDCLRIEKETGRKLRGMKMAVISGGPDSGLKLEYYMPFIETANYLGMEYIGDAHTWLEGGRIPEQAKTNLNKLIANFSNLGFISGHKYENL
jgi:putative NADPH-quinone reductase